MASSSGFVTQKVIENSSNIMCAKDFSQNNNDFKDIYYSELKKLYDSQTGAIKNPWTNNKVFEVIRHLKNAKVSIESGCRRTPAEYYWSKKYQVMSIDDVDYLILKKDKPDNPTVRIIPLEEYYDILLDIHRGCGHGGRDKIQYQIKDRFIIVRKAIDLFVSLCPICESKRNIPKKGIVAKPIISRDFNERGQVDLIDLQSVPDGEFKWLLNYQDHSTKFIHLRPLCSKKASGVATELLKIFLEFGAPYILQSDNGKEFTANIIEEMVKLWPECKIIHGTPRHPQTQGSVERSNQDVENMLRAWMQEHNSTKWAMGCFFVQYSKNTSFHRIIGRSPFRALFGCEPKSGLRSSNIPHGILKHITNEEQLQDVCAGIQVDVQGPNRIDEVIQVNESSENLTLSSNASKNIIIVSNTSIENESETLMANEAPVIGEVASISMLSENRNSVLDISLDAYTENETVVTHDDFAEDATSSVIIYSNELITLPVAINASITNTSTSIQQLGEQSNADSNVTLPNSIVMHDSSEVSTLESDLRCIVCKDGTSGAHQCCSCLRPVHTICGETYSNEGYGASVLCFLCKREKEIQLERNKSHQGVKRAAEKMITDTAKKLPPLDKGDSVFLNVPKIDRGPVDAKNISGKVLDMRHGVYQIGTSNGIIKNWFNRQELKVSSNKYLKEIPQNIISLREAVSKESLFGGQGFSRCLCKPAKRQCQNNRCACFKKNVLCGSKCHSSLTCANK